MKRLLSCFVIYIFIFTGNVYAENTELQNKKIDYVKGLSDFIFDVMSKKITKEAKISQIRGMIEKEMDFEWNAKIALGSQGRNMSPENFKHFIVLYKELLCQNWATKFSIAENATKQDLVFNNRVIKTNATDDIISFYIEAKNGNKIDIKIVVKTLDEAKSSFKVIDLIGEGVSIALSYRSQFSSYIDEHGLDAIIPHLESVIKK
jgi:phospholipid transport system substrate-binding protein